MACETIGWVGLPVRFYVFYVFFQNPKKHDFLQSEPPTGVPNIVEFSCMYSTFAVRSLGCGVCVKCQVALSSPVDVTFNDRVGLYTTGAYQLPVPFQHDHTASLYYSADTVANSSLTPSRRVRLDDLHWRRSQRRYVVFCKTAGLSRSVLAGFYSDPSAEFFLISAGW